MTLIFVRHGPNKKTMLNADCSPSILLSWLRDKCKIKDQSITLDLSDEDGNLQCISSMVENKHASRQLVDRTVYVLVEVQKEGKQVMIKPLLENWKPRFPKENVILSNNNSSKQRKCSRGSAKKWNVFKSLPLGTLSLFPRRRTVNTVQGGLEKWKILLYLNKCFVCKCFF